MAPNSVIVNAVMATVAGAAKNLKVLYAIIFSVLVTMVYHKLLGGLAYIAKFGIGSKGDFPVGVRVNPAFPKGTFFERELNDISMSSGFVPTIGGAEANSIFVPATYDEIHGRATPFTRTNAVQLLVPTASRHNKMIPQDFALCN